VNAGWGLAMAAKVFISYRRNDTKYQARMIHEAFSRVLPREHVFMDVNSIGPGANFRKSLKDWVDSCEVLLALIGPDWANATDPNTGRRRLENPSDLVRIEIGEALARSIPVVPTLIDGTPMADVASLPDDLKELVDRQAEFVEYRTFDADVERLIKKLGLAEASQEAAARPSDQTPPTPSQEDVMRSAGRVFVDAAIVHNPWFLPGAGKSEWFKDHEAGPEMVVVPAGSFMMGSPDDEPEREGRHESPQHKVVIAHPFAVARHAITRGQFDAFVSARGHKTEGGARIWKGDAWGYDPKASWRAPGFLQDDNDPVVCINWDDAKAYAACTDHGQALPSAIRGRARVRHARWHDDDVLVGIIDHADSSQL
jgi:Sulfatase-modifying factor enzyme 1/TIR domain